jgi:hypothetical protein
MASTKGQAWSYDWERAWCVYVETNLKGTPAFIGYVDDYDPETVELHFTNARDQEGKWLPYWDWVERYGPLPSPQGGRFACVMLDKASITKVNEIDEDYVGPTGRCWVCGAKVAEGKLCSKRECKALWEMADYHKDFGY